MGTMNSAIKKHNPFVSWWSRSAAIRWYAMAVLFVSIFTIPAIHTIGYVPQKSIWGTDHPKTVVCLTDVRDRYTRLTGELTSEHLVVSIESQHMAEVYTFYEICQSASGIGIGSPSHRVLMLESGEVDASHAEFVKRSPNNEFVVYVPTLPLVAHRIMGEASASALMNEVHGVVDKIGLYHTSPSSFFFVCNHWAAPFLLKPFEFRDDVVVSSENDLGGPKLFTYEDDCYLEFTFETWWRFSRSIHAVPYVENYMVNIHTINPLPRKRKMYFGGSVMVNQNTDAEKRAGAIRGSISELSSMREDVDIIDTSNIRKENEYKCQTSPDQLRDAGDTWTRCVSNGYNPWQFDPTINRDTKLYAATFMADYDFCFVPRGDTPGSSRLFDAIASGCIPVVVSDDIALPFDAAAPKCASDRVQYDRFIVRIPEDEFIADPNQAVSDHVFGANPPDVVAEKRGIMSMYSEYISYKSDRSKVVSMIIACV